MNTDDEALPNCRSTLWRRVVVSCVFLTMLVAVSPIIISSLVPTWNGIVQKSSQTETAGNCRQIIVALKLYAADHEGKYPDADASMPATSNQAFRILFREGYLDDERCFGARGSMYNPDNKIGPRPTFPEALEPGENHWAMTKGLKDSSSAMVPLVFENPVSASWPPLWNVDAAGRKEKGRAWRGGKIIVGFNDSSVQPIKLEAGRGSAVSPADVRDGKNWFTLFSETGEVLDIEE